MTPRGLLTTIGAAALGIGIVVGGAPAIADALAQEATPPAVETPAQAEQDARAAAGDLDTEAAAAIRAVIEVSEAPLFLGVGGHGGFAGRHGRGDRADFDGRDDDGALPAIPGADDASDQGAPAPAAPVEDIIF